MSDKNKEERIEKMDDKIEEKLFEEFIAMFIDIEMDVIVKDNGKIIEVDQPGIPTKWKRTKVWNDAINDIWEFVKNKEKYIKAFRRSNNES